LTWYGSTRHTFASLWVLGGGSIEKLSKIMGHSSIVVTERYAHLRLDLFPDSDYAQLSVDLNAGAAVLPLRRGTKPGTFGYSIATEGRTGSKRKTASKRNN
jgi:hypothetical protein